MLKLTDIRKDYVTGDSVVHALKGVSLEFRKSEFVSILGQSGCGKTTLLNIIGGLDQYTSGDLIINGKSTKEYGDREWDTYRNHSVGFVFQSYNLIPHQTVLANVELALTLSGVSKEERRKRATEALETVGLGEQIKKRPNQLSGGQMQRVAIARALVNDPDILLADEPTGALDSETSVQIMELLKAISKDKLIIMVTHNPDLASEYSTRIINLLDGEVINDSNPYSASDDVEVTISANAYRNGSKRELESKKVEFSAILSGLKGFDKAQYKEKKAEFNKYISDKTAEIKSKYAVLLAAEKDAKIKAKEQKAKEKLAKQKAKEDLMKEINALPSEEKAKRLEEIKAQKAQEKIAAKNKLAEERRLQKEKKRAEKKTSMSFLTALSLSKNNLMTKKGRTFLTAFAGSIGIIGIALILSVSSGVSAYITSVEEGTMSSYPIEVKQNTMDVMTLLGSLMEDGGIENPEDGIIYTHDVLATMFDSANKGLSTNNLTALKAYLDSNRVFSDNTTDIKYVYQANLNTYRIDNNGFFVETLDGIGGLMADLGMGGLMGEGDSSADMASSLMGGGAFKELVGDGEYIESQYNKLHGKFPSAPNEVVLIVDKNQQISDFTLYTLGIKSTQELKDFITAMRKGEDYEIPETTYTFEEICGYKFKVLPDSEKFKLENGKIVDRDSTEIQALLKDAMTLEIVGILSPKENSASSNVIGAIGYTPELMKTIIDKSNSNPLMLEQINNTKTNLINGLSFTPVLPNLSVVRSQMSAMLDGMLTNFGTSMDRVSDIQLISFLRTFLSSDDTFSKLLTFQMDGGLAPWGGYTAEMVPTMLKPALDNFAASNSGMLGVFCTSLYQAVTAAGGDQNFALLVNALLYPDLTLTAEELHRDALKSMGYVDYNNPSSILIYPKDFESKQIIKDEIEKYNNAQEDENNKITYTDTVALLMSSVTTIIDAITYVLIAFVAISLIVSSIMIGIITYISVLERTKEIGILRAIGASKKDISRVFNAETLIVGFAAGVLGILVSLFFIAIINIILLSLTGLETLQAVLPVGAAVILVLISMGLTLIAGIFPSRVAAKKDPVIALRTE